MTDLQALSDAATPGSMEERRARLPMRKWPSTVPMSRFEIIGAVERDVLAKPEDMADPCQYDRRGLLNLAAALLDEIDRAATPVVPADRLREARAIEGAISALAQRRPDVKAAIRLLRDVSWDRATGRLAASPSPDTDHEHYWIDAPDDETGWHCTICGVTEYPGEGDRVPLITAVLRDRGMIAAGLRPSPDTDAGLDEVGEGVMAELVGVESMLERVRTRLRRAQDTLGGGLNRAAVARLTSEKGQPDA